MASTPTNPDTDAEKIPGLTFSLATDSPPNGLGHDGTSTPSYISHGHHHHYGSRAKERLRHFLHPNGKRIHIASDPIEAEHIRRRLTSPSSPSIHEDFDIFISGTPEHLDAVRHAQLHHESRREALSNQHGEVWTQFADVQGELDVLSGELNRITDQGVSLDAHFGRFGYSAHIKSYNDESPSASGAATPRRSSEGSSATSLKEGREAYATPLKLFKVPVVRQYFHKGILWRASSYEEVQSFELFVDLLYVGIIAVNGDAAAEHPTGLSLLRFVITFTLSWKIWNDMAMIIAWFETDDIFQRFSVLFLLACLFGYTTNIMEAFEHTYATLIGFYLTARLYMVAYLVMVAILVPMVKGVMLYTVFTALITCALWIGSIHTDWPNSLVLIWIALFGEIMGQTSYIVVLLAAEKFGGGLKAFADKWFAFWPALNIEHRVERTNAFVTLVFGYTVVAMLYQSATAGIDAFFGKAILGLIQAFCFNWLYFEIDAANISLHAIRRHKISTFVWNMSHLPFIMSFVLGGGALSRLVVATDTDASHLDMLTETYQHRSEEHISAGIRWFYCAGFGTALACMGFISLSHIHKSPPTLRYGKSRRLAIRFAVALILILLPLAEHLSSVQLLGTVTGLVVFTLISELWACSCADSKLWSRDKPCKYVGNCGKKDLMALVKNGGKIDVDELGAASKYKSSGVASAPM